MEHFVLNTLSNFAQAHGFKFLKGEYVPTLKNKMVSDHYKDLGFKEDKGLWVLDLKAYRYLETFIKGKGRA